MAFSRWYSNGLWYDMAPGEVWAIDNLRPHGIYNSGACARINVLVDYVPSNALARLIADGEHGLGVTDEAAQEAIESMTKERYRKNRWRSIRYELFKLVWRRRGDGTAVTSLPLGCQASLARPSATRVGCGRRR